MKIMTTMMGRWSTALACALLLSACATQHQAAMDEVGMPQVVPTLTMVEADARLKEVASERAAAESTYAARELACYDRFFVTSCLDQAKNTRRLTLVRLRAIEAEASHFKRAESVRLRDADLARTQQVARDELAERTAATPKTMKVVTPEAVPTRPGGPTLAERQARHAAEVKQQEAKDLAEAPQRSEREANFARKQAEAVKRQERVAKRLAEREKAAADKAARAAAAASAPPPPIGVN
ncbi:hypothetical protein CD932_02715 [Janthinobacterium sp. PC23-8]|nr:hypothetical protein CD932_02715 [Janthinobacterium sp. PC23-8]